MWGAFFLTPGLGAGLFLIFSLKNLRMTEYAPAMFWLGVAVTVVLCHLEVYFEMNSLLRQQLSQATMCNMAIYSLFISGSYMPHFLWRMLIFYVFGFGSIALRVKL